MSFEHLKIIEPILKALKAEGYINPTPIQEQSIPIILEKKDLLGCAQTGTGKTAAFAIPILQILQEEKKAGPHQIKALILTPTRELAIQIDESFAAYGKFLGLKHLVVYGGVSQVPQVNSLRHGVDILIATPGRLLDLIDQRFISLQHISLFVLDEADRMLDMGFIHDVKKIITRIPAKRQTLFFSATMPPEISGLADSILRNPEKVAINAVSSTAENVVQSLYYVNRNDKRSLLLHILEDKSIQSALVFTRTKHGADKLVKDLQRANISSAAIHGNKSQSARQNALTQFKVGRIRVLVATDIAARGIDVENLSHVINYELPNIPETYVHRIGRTGRAGMSGIALSFCDGEERAFLRDINKLISVSIPVVEDHPFHMAKVVNAPNHLVQRNGPPRPQNSNFQRERNWRGTQQPVNNRGLYNN